MSNKVAPMGILGGTFDPVHRAHLQLAEDALVQLRLGKVLWIPSGKPPHRKPPVASAEQRLAMVALAIMGHADFLLDESEARSSVTSYTVNTLTQLRQVHGERPLVLLLGADAFLGLASWHRWREIFTLAHVAVATRPRYPVDVEKMDLPLREECLPRLGKDSSVLAENPAGSIVTFPITPMDISASQIRARLGAQQDAQDLLPPVVLDYIANHHPYSAR